MKKHHQRKLQRVNHHVCKVTICTSGCRKNTTSGPTISLHASCTDCCIMLCWSYLVGGGCGCMLCCIPYQLALMLALPFAPCFLPFAPCILTFAPCGCGVSLLQMVQPFHLRRRWLSPVATCAGVFPAATSADSPLAHVVVHPLQLALMVLFNPTTGANSALVFRQLALCINININWQTRHASRKCGACSGSPQWTYLYCIYILLTNRTVSVLCRLLHTYTCKRACCMSPCPWWFTCVVNTLCLYIALLMCLYTYQGNSRIQANKLFPLLLKGWQEWVVH